MSQITLVIPQVPQSEQFFRWQATAIAAFAGGSLTAALLNLGSALALAVARTALGHANPALKRTNCHA